MDDIIKGKSYRRKIVAAAKIVPNHPIHHINMQAHHLLSEAGIKKSKQGRKLAHLGYEIDSLLNLVLLPCELEDACHMRVQLHRGDHKTPDLRRWELENGITIDEEDDYHEVPYHDRVANFVKSARIQIEKICDLDDASKQKKANLLNSLMSNKSLHILEEIKNFKTDLTSVSTNFAPSSNLGCANLEKVGKSLTPCKKNRLHNHHISNNYTIKQGV